MNEPERRGQRCVRLSRARRLIVLAPRRKFLGRLTRAVAFVGMNTLLVVAVYLGWVFYSYRLLPYAQPLHHPVPKWALSNYYKFRPGVYEYPYYGTSFVINSRGFRGPEFPVRSSHRWRLIALGESSTMGLESSESETWPRHLERVLRERGLDVEVINCGISESNSRDHRYLIRELATYHPDVVLYYAGNNEHDIPEVERYPGPTLWPTGRLEFLRHLFVLRAIQARLLFLKLAGVDLGWGRGRWPERYEDNLRSLVDTAESRGIRFVLINQVLDYPVAISADILDGAHQRQLAAHLSLRQPNWFRFLRGADVVAIQRRVASRYSLIVDPTTEFQQRKRAGEQLFFDHVHLTPVGNSALADIVAGKISDWLLIGAQATVR